MSRYRLFGELADRYDLHTPPDHYQHDHQFVLDIAGAYRSGARLLDVGCGTGAFLQKARAAGLEAYGLDASPEMVALCQAKLGAGSARVQRMQDLDERGRYDVICALSWTLHYAEDMKQIEDILGRCRRALRDRGTLVLQVADPSFMDGKLNVDQEAGMDGTTDDIVLLYRFLRDHGDASRLLAQYVLLSWSAELLVREDHVLVVAAVKEIKEMAVRAGFVSAEIAYRGKDEDVGGDVSCFVVCKTID